MKNIPRFIFTERRRMPCSSPRASAAPSAMQRSRTACADRNIPTIHPACSIPTIPPAHPYPQDSAPAQYAAPRAQYPEYPEYPASSTPVQPPSSSPMLPAHPIPPRSRAAISPMPAARSRLISSPPRRYIRSIHRALRKTTRPRSRLTIPRAIRAAITMKPRRRAAARTMGCGCWRSSAASRC